MNIVESNRRYLAVPIGPARVAGKESFTSLSGRARWPSAKITSPSTIVDRLVVAGSCRVGMGLSYYAQGPGQKPVEAVVDHIRRLGGEAPEVTVLPIEYGSSDFGPVQLPLFRVQTVSGDKYVDNTGRAYSS